MERVTSPALLYSPESCCLSWKKQKIRWRGEVQYCKGQHRTTNTNVTVVWTEAEMEVKMKMEMGDFDVFTMLLRVQVLLSPVPKHARLIQLQYSGEIHVQTKL